MKKIVSIILSAMLVCSIQMTVFADDTQVGSDTGANSATTTITYHVPSSYIVNIPEVIEANDTDYYFTASMMDLADNETVEISIWGLDDSGKLTLSNPDKNGSVYIRPYIPNGMDTIPNGSVIAYFSNGMYQCDRGIRFALDSMTGGTTAGDYTGTVTFNVELTTMN